MRQLIIAANWKMHMTPDDSLEYLKELRSKTRGFQGVEVVLCPPFPSLGAVRDLAVQVNVVLGGQDLYWEKEGAYTGEVSALMLRECSCHYCIVGHSERRRLFNEGDEQVRRKAAAALEYGLAPIICVGEDEADLQAGRREAVLYRQVQAALSGLQAEQAARVLIAYEPVWAIGSGNPATGEDAGLAAGLIRSRIADLLSNETAEKVRILYGGSVNAGNIAEFVGRPDIDGALVGGASLKVDELIAIINNAAATRE